MEIAKTKKVFLELIISIIRILIQNASFSQISLGAISFNSRICGKALKLALQLEHLYN